MNGETEKQVGINGTDSAIFVSASRRRYSNLHLRSEIAQEVISGNPTFIERWALLIFVAILLLLLTAAWFIRYPDFVETAAWLTSSNAPKEIVPRQEGRLAKLFIHNNEKVAKGQVFGWIESAASHEEVLELSKEIDSSIDLMDAGQVEKIPFLFNKRIYNLGEIQQSYQTFTAALQLFNDYKVNGFYSRQVGMLQNDIRSIESANRSIRDQKALTEQDIKVAEESYNMNKKLLEEKIISKEEFRIATSKILNKQMAIPQLETSLLSNESQKRDKLRELQKIDHDIEQQQLTFLQALQSLKSAIDEWKQKFVLQSPVDGKIFFIVPMQESQFLQQGKLIGYIVPDNSHYYAQANLPQNNFGKIDTGLQVQLRFDAYPYQEMGFIKGTLSYVSNVPSDSGFLANIRLDNGLITNNNKPIPFKSGLKAQAIIITRNLRLLQRLWYNTNKMTSVGVK